MSFHIFQDLLQKASCLRQSLAIQKKEHNKKTTTLHITLNKRHSPPPPRRPVASCSSPQTLAHACMHGSCLLEPKIKS